MGWGCWALPAPQSTREGWQNLVIFPGRVSACPAHGRRLPELFLPGTPSAELQRLPSTFLTPCIQEHSRDLAWEIGYLPFRRIVSQLHHSCVLSLCPCPFSVPVSSPCDHFPSPCPPLQPCFQWFPQDESGLMKSCPNPAPQ